MSYEVPLRGRDLDAIHHLANAQRNGGIHSLTACPYPLRALCSFRDELASLEARGFDFVRPGELLRPSSAYSRIHIAADAFYACCGRHHSDIDHTERREGGGSRIFRLWHRADEEDLRLLRMCADCEGSDVEIVW